MVGDHLAARGTVVHEEARLNGSPFEANFFTRRDHRQAAATQRAGRRMEVDVVRHRVGRFTEPNRVRSSVDQRQVHPVPLEHDGHRTRNAVVEGHLPDEYARRDFDFPLDDL
jgi:hypothetical protein